MNSPGGKLSRRQFTRSAAAGAALFTIVPRHVLGGQGEPGANDKLNIAVIGIGGQGAANLKRVSGENIVGLCDVDDRRASKSFESFPHADRRGGAEAGVSGAYLAAW